MLDENERSLHVSWQPETSEKLQHKRYKVEIQVRSRMLSRDSLKKANNINQDLETRERKPGDFTESDAQQRIDSCGSAIGRESESGQSQSHGGRRGNAGILEHTRIQGGIAKRSKSFYQIFRF